MRRSASTALLAAVALVLGACGNGDGTPTTTRTTGGPTSQAASYPVTIGQLTLNNRPERIVSLSATATEMLFAIGAGPQVAAVDTNANYPSEVAKLPHLSSYPPNAEAIANTQPDLVVISNDTGKLVEQLTKLKVPVLLSPAPTTLDGAYAEISDLGKLTGHPTEAADVVRRMTDEIGKLIKSMPARATPLSYYYELSTDLYTVTSKTFVGSLFAMVGLRNVADPADAAGTHGGYPQLSRESLVKANPDMIFLADVKCCKQSAETIKARAGWSGVTAVRTGQIVALDDDIASRWGPRVVDLLRAIVEAVAKVPA